MYQAFFFLRDRLGQLAQGLQALPAPRPRRKGDQHATEQAEHQAAPQQRQADAQVAADAEHDASGDGRAHAERRAGPPRQLAPGAVVVITGVGAARTPPANPGTGITVYPTFIFGRDAYGQVMLDDMKFYYLKGAEKVDPLDQLRMVGYKVMYGTIILNNNFFLRIESTSNFSATFG